MTGGVNNSMDSEDILDKKRLWEELLCVNQDFLFGCSSRRGNDEEPADTDGFVRGHAYTVLEAREFEGQKLLKIRNPWGRQEWNGAWSDGSKEWTSEALQELGHTFGDDGIFWISYKDFLTYYPRIDRTRLFGPEWYVTQQWTSVNVPHHPSFQSTGFRISIQKAGSIVIVLSQPDSRYFQGFQGRYRHELYFRVYRDGESTYLLRSMGHSGTGRSCNAELEVIPGSYTVLIKITATRDEDYQTAEELIKKGRKNRRDKLLAVGKSFDMIHSKGLLRERENENTALKKKETKRIMVQKEAKLMKARRAWKQEAKRRAKLRKQRIENAMKKKRETSIGEKTVQSQGNPTKAEASEDEEEDEDDSESAEKDTNTDAESQENDQGGTTNINGVEKGKEGEAAVGEISDVSDDDLDWDSDLDGPIPPPEDVSDDEDSDSLFGEDPWNAICVLGLRVHSTDENTQVKVVDIAQKPQTEVA